MTVGHVNAKEAIERIQKEISKETQKKKIKQTKERNLLDGLRDYQDKVLLFMKIKNVPFTNNQAERDIRRIKVQQKVSGQFKSMASARHFVVLEVI